MLRRLERSSSFLRCMFPSNLALRARFLAGSRSQGGIELKVFLMQFQTFFYHSQNKTQTQKRSGFWRVVASSYQDWLYEDKFWYQVLCLEGIAKSDYPWMWTLCRNIDTQGHTYSFPLTWSFLSEVHWLFLWLVGSLMLKLQVSLLEHICFWFAWSWIWPFLHLAIVLSIRNFLSGANEHHVAIYQTIDLTSSVKVFAPLTTFDSSSSVSEYC